MPWILRKNRPACPSLARAAVGMLALALLCSPARAQTTATGGSWTSGSTWVGGVAPGTTVTAGTVTIQHPVTLSTSLSLSATMDVNTGGALTISQNLTHSGGSIAVRGTLTVEGNLVVNGGNLNIESGGTLIVYGNLAYSGSSINVNGGGRFILFGDYNQTAGNFNNASGGIFLVAGQFNATGGNADNNGTTYLFDDSPIIASGNNWSCSPPPGVCQYRNYDDAIADGVWGLFGSANIYYSYRTGPFDHPDTWTTDPGGTTLVGTYTPAPGNRYVILAGRTVTLTADVPLTGLSVTISSGGALNMGGMAFSQTLARLAGGGTLRVSSSVLPLVSNNLFVTENGGTVEFNNTADFTLPPSWPTYNHLLLNLNPHTLTATMLHHLTLHGNLAIGQGGFRINNNTSTTRLHLNIGGSVTVSAQGRISVGNGSTNTQTSPLSITGGTAPFVSYYEQFHRVVIQGDLINHGAVRFTNLPFPVFNSFPPLGSTPTSGAASVYFRGLRNSALVCNGPTDFYNLILDKGSDQTFELSVSSAQYQFFRLFGANTAGGEGGGDNPILKKALWLRNGTLRLFGNVVIPSLTEGACAAETPAANPNSDFYIPANAGLIIESPDVIVLTTASSFREVNAAYGVSAPDDAAMGINPGAGCSSFSVLGLFVMENGYLSTRESGGIIYWGTSAGQIVINGGTVDAKQLRTAGSAGGLAAYRQSGGRLSLRGRFTQTITAATVTNAASLRTVPLNTARNAGGLEASVGTFNIDRDDNIFEMTGGTIEIFDVCGDASAQRRAFEVNALPAFVNVTGGTVIIRPTSGTAGADAPYHVASAAPLFNLTIDRASGTQPVRLMGIPAKTGVTTRPSPPLAVINHLTLSNGATLQAENLEVMVGGNFVLPTGTTYTPGTNRTTFNGSGTQSFTGGGTITDNFHRLVVDKPGGTLTLAGPPTSFTVRDSLIIAQGTLNDGGKTLNVQGHVLVGGIHTGTGRIALNGTAAQRITFDVFASPRLGNVELNNTGNGTLINNGEFNSFTFTNGLLHIGPYRLTILTPPIAGGSTTRYFRSNGLASDGGLRMRVNAATLTTGNRLVFPVGVSGKYTPCEIVGGSAPGSGTGFVTFIPVNSRHPAQNPSGRHLHFYWRTIATGMPAGANVFYQCHNTHVPDWESGANRGFVLIDGQREWNNTAGSASINEWVRTDGIPNSQGFISADITAGNNGAFNNVDFFYSIGSGNFNSPAVWSTTSHAGPACSCAPSRASDYVYIGGVPGRNDVITATAGFSAATVEIRGSFTGNEERPTLNIQGHGGSISIGVVRGEGRFVTTSATIPGADYGDFTDNTLAVFEYAGGAYTLGTTLTTYPNLHITSTSAGQTKTLPDANVLVRGNLRMSSAFTGSTLALNASATPRTLTVHGNLEQTNASRLTIPATTGQKTINIHGSINFRFNSTDHANGITVAAGAGTTHRLNFHGSSIASGNSVLTLFNSSGSNHMDLHLLGPGSVTVTNTTGATTNFSLNRLVVNKDGLADWVHFQNNFTLGADAGGAIKPLGLIAGTLHLEHPTTNITLTTGGGLFTIPQASALILRNGARVQVPPSATSGTGVFLDGLLRAEGSSEINIGDGSTANNLFIEYSGSGRAAIELAGASILRVNTQIRRSTSQTNGVLRYTQAGTSQTIIFGRGGTPTRAKLEVLNSGSHFAMADNSSLTIVRGGGTTFGDLMIRPSSGGATGGTIHLGSTVNNQTFRLDAAVPLHSLNVVSPSASNTAQLMVNPLVLTGHLTIGSNTTLNANGIDVRLMGNFTNNGAYTWGTGNTTTFNGVTQQLAGASPTSFFNLVVSPTTSATLSRNIIVQNHLTLSRGALVANAFHVEVRGNLTNNAVHSSTTGRLILNGTDGEQGIFGSGTYGLLELNNGSGARLHSNITLTRDLHLANGILNINQQLLTLREESNITVAGSFGPNRMIAPNGVWSDVGIRKFFNPITAPTTFTFPLGVTGAPNKYTPAVLHIGSTGPGFIRINPINDRHPATFSPFRVLRYYWDVENTVSNFTGDFVFHYMQSDVVANPDDEAHYVAARVVVGPGDSWSKAASDPATDNVDEAANQILFKFTDASELGGEYTAGRGEDIPDIIPIFYSRPGVGVWNDVHFWDPVAPAGGPNGFRVVIPAGSTVQTNGNRRFAYRTTINGRLEVGETFGHNLGTILGTGTLALHDQILPAGRFTHFFGCNGGTLEYGGPHSFTIIADRIDTLRNLHFVGTGTITLPNKDLVICNQLLIDGPTVSNASNRQLTIGGAMQRASGVFLAGTGAGATVRFRGTAPQSLSGFSVASGSPLHNMEIDNPDGLTLASQIDINGNLLLTHGLIHTTSSNILHMRNAGGTSTVTPAGGTALSYVSGPMRRYIFGGNDFIFPIGRGTRYGRLGLLSPTTGDWVAEYFNTPYGDLSVTGGLHSVSSSEHWRIIPIQTAAQATVQLRWDGQSDINPQSVTGGLGNIRVAEFNGTDWDQRASTTSGSSSQGLATTSANIAIANTGHPQFYTLGAVTAVSAMARFASSDARCQGAVIPITFSGVTAAQLPFVLSYTLNGVPQPNISITALPYPGLPTPTAGSYQLTGFQYGSPLVAGVVGPETATVHPTPAPPSAAPASRCGPGALTLTAGGAGVGEAYRWYTAPTGGSLLQEGGANYTTPFLNASTTYSVALYNTTTGCESVRTPAQAIVNRRPEFTLTGTTNLLCEGEPFTLTVNFGYVLPPYSITIHNGAVNVVNLTGQTNTVSQTYHNPAMPWIGPFGAQNVPYTVTVTQDNGCANDPIPPFSTTVLKIPETGPQLRVANTHGL